MKAVNKVVAKPAPKKPSANTGIVAQRMPAAQPVSIVPRPPVRKPVATEAPIQHISQEDAVAKIQALLEAKQERVRQGPSWPDANPAHPASNGAELHPPMSTEAGGGSGDGRVLAPQRGEQSKRKD